LQKILLESSKLFYRAYYRLKHGNLPCIFLFAESKYIKNKPRAKLFLGCCCKGSQNYFIVY
jgi:hypothetical protein